MKDDYNRTVSLQCPTCGGTNYEMDNRPQLVCAKCGLEISEEALKEANGARIESVVDEVKGEIFKDVRADLKKAFRKWK